MNVLSAFDGISCGQLALKRAGVSVDNYYASEIDKHSIAVTMHNFPETKQVGDILKLDLSTLPKIDLLMGGSPCQGFSMAGKQLNFEDPRSKLFFDYVRIKNELDPLNWLFENVIMKAEYRDRISELLGAEPIEINSSLVSAQNRRRLYWGNFEMTQPDDAGIGLMDILDDKTWTNPGAVRGRRLNKASIIGRRLDSRGCRKDYDKDIPIVQYLEVRKTNVTKSNCLTTVEKDNVLTPLAIGRHPDAFKDELPFRYYTRKEYCRLQTLPTDYFPETTSDSQVKRLVGMGWTVDVIAHLFRW